MKYGRLVFWVIMLSSGILQGQDQVHLSDSIYVAWHGGSMCYQHVVAPGETLYSLCRKFNTNIDEVYRFNPAMEGSLLGLGQKIWVPTDHLLKERPKVPPVITILYRVQPGETLFRIAKVFLKEDVETLMQRNQLTDHQIRPGQNLVIGWLAGATVSSDAQLLIGGSQTSGHSDVHHEGPQNRPLATEKTSKDSSMIAPEAKEMILRVKNTAGVAYRIESNGGQKKYFALHDKAAINSYIEITNPMFNNKVLAKVIGRIPKGVYPNDLEIIVSPSVAKDLRILDKRFYVQLKYLY